MTLTKSTSPVLTSARRNGAGLILAAVLLGGSLTACGGNDPGDTTCGEYKDMSDGERFDVLKDEVDDNGTDEEKDAIDDASDEVKKTATDAIAQVCDGEDDDTKLDDVEP